MLLSPPFIPDPQPNESDDQFLDRAMTDAAAGDGGYPVSYEVNWHGGLHLNAPSGAHGPLPVRAIADGTVSFVRQPTAKSNDPQHPLNYGGQWTDDGCVAIRHETDIGMNLSTRQLTSVVFYSIYMHLKAIEPTIAQNGRVFRKDRLGRAGAIEGKANRVHFEIICDDDNVQRLTGRKDPYLLPGSDGRTDVVYGAIWFFLPVNTKFFSTDRDPRTQKPMDPPLQTIHETDEGMFVRMRFERGSAYLQNHHLDARPLGNEVRELAYEYSLYTNAMEQFPNSPSAGYELFRFGRIIGPDPLDPPDGANWHRVDSPAGTGWVNLNAPGVTKFSDADFPSWDKWWVLVDGSAGPDSRCQELPVLNLLDINHDLSASPEEAQQALNTPDVQQKLARKVCKFPTEWDASTLDARYGWLKAGNPARLSAPQFDRFKAHASSLCFWQQANLGIRGAPWHFQPKQFVGHFRKCSWLSEGEFAQCIPRKVTRLHDTTPHTYTKVSWAVAQQRSQTWVTHINVSLRKYRISATTSRLLHFLAQAVLECDYCGSVKEGGGENYWYNPYYGRGLIQITTLPNYQVYGNYRRFTIHLSPPSKFADLGWDPDDLIAQDDTHFNAPNCADSAAFYWTCSSITATGENGIHISDDAGLNVTDIVHASRLTNGNVPIRALNGLDERIGNFVYLKYVLLDLLRPDSLTEQVTFTWRRTTAPELLFDQNNNAIVDAKGNQRRGYVDTSHTLNYSLSPQRP